MRGCGSRSKRAAAKLSDPMGVLISYLQADRALVKEDER